MKPKLHPAYIVWGVIVFILTLWLLINITNSREEERIQRCLDAFPAYSPKQCEVITNQR